MLQDEEIKNLCNSIEDIKKKITFHNTAKEELVKKQQELKEKIIEIKYGIRIGSIFSIISKKHGVNEYKVIDMNINFHIKNGYELFYVKTNPIKKDGLVGKTVRYFYPNTDFNIHNFILEKF